MNPTSKNVTHFKWTGIDAQGKKLIGEIQAPNKLAAMTQLKKKNILLITLHKKILERAALFSNRIPSVMILFFFRQLAVLISAGVPIVQSLIILSQSHHHAEFQKIITSIQIDLEAGKALAASVRPFPRCFDKLTCQLIQIGEETGTLNLMLKRIADYKENLLFLKKKFIQSLFYPGIILATALLVSFIMLTWVVPRFAELFQSMHGKLPALTLFIIYLSDLIRHHGWFIFFIPSIVVIIVFKQLHSSSHLRQQSDYLILKIPIIGPILTKVILARFARSLAIALSSGMPIIEALKIIATITLNLFYERAILFLQTEIEKGQQLNKSMQKNTAFPIMMIQMIKMGEESGMLEEMLDKLANIYESDVDHLITNLMQALEPLIMIILGVLIGVLVIAMYLPIFKLGTLM
jgi:type IV pilus assembly protein PilC